MTSLDARELCSAGFPDYPAGTLRMIAPQLARFLLMVMKGGAYLSVRLLAPALVRQMLSPQYPSLDPTIGMLWFSIRQGGDTIVGHEGEDPGVNTLMYFRPKDQVGVIVLARVFSYEGVTFIEFLLLKRLSKA
jgi:CubicO group peptidase (beta-lactamase class C family)